MNCEMIKGSDVPITNSRSITVRRNAAIGDVLSASVVCDKLIERGYDVVYQCHTSTHCVMRRHGKLARVEEPRSPAEVNLDGCYETNPNRRRLHFHEMFIQKSNEQLARFGIFLGAALNCKPSLRVTPMEKQVASAKFKDYPRPWIFICPRSDAYAARQVPDGIWMEAAKKMKGTKFWLGRHPGPAGIVDLKNQHLDNVIIWLAAADLLVSVDTGPLHIAAALGIPIVALGQSSSPDLHLNDQCDFITINPKLDCLNCQQNICPINTAIPPCQNFEPQFIADWTNAKLNQIYSESISAVVAIYKPEADTLNRCLNQLLPQVSEIVVAADAGSVVPQGMMVHPKIRLVTKPIPNIGYGRKVNFGARQTVGKYLLICNDDCFLAPGAVEKMLEVFAQKPDAGMVCNLLRKMDGVIWHSGKRRTPGQRGWAHIDFGHRDCTIKEVTEMENCAGTCVLVKRKTHFEINGFDEDFYLYAEDDDYALKVRRAGQRIYFTPFSEGIHMEHQSTSKTGNIMDFVNASNKVFGRKWGRYLDHNANNSMGNFNY